MLQPSWIRFFCLLTCTFFGLAGCSGSKSLSVGEANPKPGVTKQVAMLQEVRLRGQEPISTHPDFSSVPSPAALYPLVEPTESTDAGKALQDSRTSSYIEGTELPGQVWTYHNVEYVQDYTQGLPSTHSLMFFPKANPPDTAFKTYKWHFWWYSTPWTLNFDWLWPPTGYQEGPYSQYWVGFANWDTDQWDWFEGPPDNSLFLDHPGTYIDNSGMMLTTIMVMGNRHRPQLESMNFGSFVMRGTGGSEFTAEENYKIPNVYHATLPPACDLRANLPPAGNQEQTYSCLTWAYTHGALDYELSRNYSPFGWDISQANRRASPRFVYLEGLYRYDLWPDTHQGAPVRALLLDLGAPTEESVPWGNSYLDPDFTSRDYGAEAWNQVPLFDIDDFWSTRAYDNPGFLNNIKTVLANHRRPVVLSILIDTQWGGYPYSMGNPPPLDNTPGAVWHFNNQIRGIHAALAVGYSDALQAVRLRNSWGSSWGYSGDIWASYDNFDEDSAITGANFVKEEFSLDTYGYYYHMSPMIHPPQWVRASGGTYPDRIVVDWEPVPNAVGYEVCRDTEGGAIVSVAAPSHSFTDYGAADGLSHAYWIKVYFPYGGASELSRPDIGFSAPLAGPGP